MSDNQEPLRLRAARLLELEATWYELRGHGEKLRCRELKSTAAELRALHEKSQCWCLTCRPYSLLDTADNRMALCPTCGNKRCPRANDHRNACTGSNAPGQVGSAYERMKDEPEQSD